jgi:hypothetical protein
MVQAEKQDSHYYYYYYFDPRVVVVAVVVALLLLLLHVPFQHCYHPHHLYQTVYAESFEETRPCS